MPKDFDKIGIILIDDNPESLQITDYENNIEYPDLISENEILNESAERFSDYFDLKWFSSCKEVRKYRDSIRLIGYKSPTLLTEENLIGELLFFDYAMTKNTKTVEERCPDNHDVIERLSILPKLDSILDRLDIEKYDPLQTPMPVWSGGVNNDDQGCFAGGLLFSLLADYPWAPVALTRKNTQQLRPEVRFFEWMLESDTNHAFENKGRPSPTWDELITEGVQTLRIRIEELATAGIIYLNLYDLLKLVEPEYPLPEFDANATEPEEPTLTFHSRYGKKTLPINGLFIDISEENRSEEVKKWAKSILEKLLRNNKIEDLEKGLELTNRLFKSYTSLRLRMQRHTLSDAVKKLTEHWLKIPQDEKERLENAREWVSRNLKTLFNADKNEEIEKGMELARSIFDSYLKLPLEEQNDLLSEVDKGLQEVNGLLSKKRVNPSQKIDEKAREQLTNILKNILKKLYGSHKSSVIKSNLEFADSLWGTFTRLTSDKQNELLSEMVKGLDELRERWINERIKKQDGNIPDDFKMTITKLGKLNDAENLILENDSLKSYIEYNQKFFQKGKKILKKYMREYIKDFPPNDLKIELRKKLGKSSSTDVEPELERILNEKRNLLNMQFKKYWDCPIDNNSDELDADCMIKWFDIRTEEYTPIQKRWAVLFMIVKLYRFQWTAKQTYYKTLSELRKQDPDKAGLLSKHMHIRDFDRTYTRHDLYEAMYPLAKDEQIVIPPKNIVAYWGHASRGDMGVSFQDIMERKGEGDKGFMKGERSLLIMYANSFKDWNWEKDVPSLRAILKPEVDRS